MPDVGKEWSPGFLTGKGCKQGEGYQRSWNCGRKRMILLRVVPLDRADLEVTGKRLSRMHRVLRAQRRLGGYSRETSGMMRGE